MPLLRGRMDRERIAVIDHSMGGHTGALLAGATATDIHSGEKVDLSDPRISAFVAISPPGTYEGAGEWLNTTYPESLQIDFGTMTKPVMVVVGTDDHNPNFSTRLDWRVDAYNLAPGPRTLLTVNGAEHIFGGVSGWDAAETSDENPALVAELQRATWAYLHSALYPEDAAWDEVVEGFCNDADPFAVVQTK